jgi:response regulator NasT
MSDQLRIAIIGLGENDEAELRNTLTQLGHTANQHVPLRGAAELVQPVDILFVSLRAVQSAGEGAFKEPNGLPTAPIIIVRDVASYSVADCPAVWGHVSPPFGPADVALALSIATGHFKEVANLQKEISELRNLLHDRKIIEKAKGIVMRLTSADESTAFKQLQKLARQRSRKMVDIAQGIIDSNAAVEAIKNTQGNS